MERSCNSQDETSTRKIDDLNSYNHNYDNLLSRKDKARELASNALKKNISSKKSIISKINKAKQTRLKDSLNDLEHVFKTKNIDFLPNEILILNSFKQYSLCQIVIHELGNQNSKINSFSRVKGSSSHALNVSVFNRVFSNIKKSKHKLFNKEHTFNENIQLSGSFLGKECDLQNFRAIIILSREDFLHPSKEEQIYFNFFVESITPILQTLLIRTLQKQKAHHTQLLIDGSDKMIQFNSSATSNILHFQRISLLGELLNTLKHELSNPIFGIKLITDLLTQGTPNDDLKSFLEEISKNCTRCQSIIKNFSHLYNENHSVDSINLKDFIGEILTLTKSATLGIDKKIIFECDENICLNNLNTTWMTQILFNFIINSTQAINANKLLHAPPQITILVSRQRPYIEISIIDNGIGIDNIHIDKIIAPFFTTKKNGNGLGLTICNNLTEKLGGILKYFNNATSGATFKILLPDKIVSEQGCDAQ